MELHKSPVSHLTLYALFLIAVSLRQVTCNVTAKQ